MYLLYNNIEFEVASKNVVEWLTSIREDPLISELAKWATLIVASK
jgi:hypothetical protein